MANITIPNPNAPLATGSCPSCGAQVTLTIDPLWYRMMNALVTIVNKGLT